MKRILTGALMTVLLLTVMAYNGFAQTQHMIRAAANKVQREGIATPLPGTASVFFDDFFQFDANGANNAGWILTAVGTSPVVAWDEEYGVVRVITGGTENNGDNAQWNNEIFKLDNDRVTFETRIKCSEDVESDFVVGLLSTDTTIIDTTEVVDGIFFKKIDGDSLLVATITKNSTDISDTLGVVSDNTYMTLKFEVNYPRVTYWVDGVYTGATALADSSSIPNDEELTPSIAFETGAAAAESLYVDYIYARQDR